MFVKLSNKCLQKTCAFCLWMMLHVCVKMLQNLINISQNVVWICPKRDPYRCGHILCCSKIRLEFVGKTVYFRNVSEHHATFCKVLSNFPINVCKRHVHFVYGWVCMFVSKCYKTWSTFPKMLSEFTQSATHIVADTSLAAAKFSWNLLVKLCISEMSANITQHFAKFCKTFQ